MFSMSEVPLGYIINIIIYQGNCREFKKEVILKKFVQGFALHEPKEWQHQLKIEDFCQFSNIMHKLIQFN